MTKLDIGFFRNDLGARLAYGRFGAGPAVVCPPGWFSHVQLQWESPAFRGFFQRIAEARTLVFYDRQGTGLSQRTGTDFSLAKELRDLEILTAHLGLQRLSLLGISQGGALALAYAAAHPDRVDRLAVYGSYARGSRLARTEVRTSLVGLVRAHWGLGSRTFASLFIPSLLHDPDAVAWLDRYQREAVEPKTAARILESVFLWDVSGRLHAIRAPTLVIHRRRDQVMRLACGMEIAEGVPGARLAVLEGDVHLPWMGAAGEVRDVLEPFLGVEGARPPIRPSPVVEGRPAETPTALGAGRYGVQRLAVGRGTPPRSRVRVAVAQVDTVALLHRREDGLFGVTDAGLDEMARRVREAVEEAAARGAALVLLPELAVDLARPELAAEVERLAHRHGLWVVPGAFHEPATRRNVSRVIGPDGALWEQTKHVPAVITVDGRRIEEPIRTDPERRVAVVDTPLGRTAVVVCRDFLDLDLRVALKNADPPVDLVLNPAYTPVTADFAAAHFEARRSLYAFTFFANQAPFGGSLVSSPEKRRRRRTLGPGRVGVLTADVDLLALRAERARQGEAFRGRFIQSTR